MTARLQAAATYPTHFKISLPNQASSANDRMPSNWASVELGLSMKRGQHWQVILRSASEEGIAGRVYSVRILLSGSTRVARRAGT